jgi:hypothetical protein
MANFITTSVTWEGKSMFDALLREQFIGKSPLETQGVKVMPNVQSTTLLNLFGAPSKISRAYVKGFNPATGTTYTRRSVDVVQMKSEMAQDANEFYQTVYEQIQGKGVEWNDVEKAKLLNDIITSTFLEAFNADLFRNFWLNDTNKETVVGGVYSGVADTDYNMYDGMWKKIIDDSALVPSASQIQLFDYSASSVAQVDTVSVTGTSGTANVTFNGIDYLATFDTSLTVTAANFVTAHAAALLLRGVVVTSSVADLIFTSSIPGQPFTAVAIANVTGDLAGTRAASVANTSPAALASGAAKAQLKTMYTDSPAELRAYPNDKKVYLVDGYTYENYLTTLESTGSAGEFSVESGRSALINGQPVLKFRGIPVINMDWDVNLNADFPKASGELPARPYRIIYTAHNNLVMAIDAMSDQSKFEHWFNKDEQENRFRMQYRSGAQFVFNNVMSVSYEA